MSYLTPTKTKAKTMTDYVYGQIREDIIQGKLAPELKLKIEQLRQDYDVGATPIREALSRLSSDGFVVTEGQRGFRVAPISYDDLVDITELRINLELMALRTSLLKGDDEWEAHVVSSYYQLQKTEEQGIPNNLEQWEQRNQAFHHALISACTSKWLLHFYSILYDQHKRYRNISLSTNITKREVHLEHQRIYDAVLARDIETACHETEQHIRRTAAITQQILKDK